MVDIHCHILPDLDDGADSMEEALAMAELAVSSGVTVICATPHTNLFPEKPNYESKALQLAYEQFRQVLQREGIPLQILQGAELFVTPDASGLLLDKKIPSMNHTHRYLMEFDFEESPDFMFDALQDMTQIGIRPIVAHPERYFCVQEDPFMLEDWMELGVLTQVNKSSVLGKFGRECEMCADFLLDRDLVTCIASDAHTSYVRTTDMREISAYLARAYSQENRDRLLQNNPRRILGI